MLRLNIPCQTGRYHIACIGRHKAYTDLVSLANQGDPMENLLIDCQRKALNLDPKTVKAYVSLACTDEDESRDSFQRFTWHAPSKDNVKAPMPRP